MQTVRLVPVARAFPIVSDSTNSTYYPLDVGEAADWGPMLAGITAHTNNETGTAIERALVWAALAFRFRS